MGPFEFTFPGTLPVVGLAVLLQSYKSCQIKSYALPPARGGPEGLVGIARTGAMAAEARINAKKGVIWTMLDKEM